jgi:hypothetical protein
LQEYYKVTGKFYYKQLPKSDVRVILAVLVILLSFVLPAIQYQKWKKAMDYVKYAAANNLGLKAGGTKETMEVFRRAAERYEQEVAGGSGGAVKQAKMMKDPEFLRIIDEVKIIEHDVSLFQWSVLCCVSADCGRSAGGGGVPEAQYQRRVRGEAGDAAARYRPMGAEEIQIPLPGRSGILHYCAAAGCIGASSSCVNVIMCVWVCF